MYNSTSTPEPVGECPKCGYQCFKGIIHYCPTAPKFIGTVPNNNELIKETNPSK